MVDAVSSFNVAPRVQQNQNVQTNQQQDPIVNYSNTNNTDTVEISSKKTTGEKAVIATVATLGVTGLALGIDALLFKGKGRKAILKIFKGEVDDVANKGKGLVDDVADDVAEQGVKLKNGTTVELEKNEVIAPCRSKVVKLDTVEDISDEAGKVIGKRKYIELSDESYCEAQIISKDGEVVSYEGIPRLKKSGLVQGNPVSASRLENGQWEVVIHHGDRLRDVRTFSSDKARCLKYELKTLHETYKPDILGFEQWCFLNGKRQSSRSDFTSYCKYKKDNVLTTEWITKESEEFLHNSSGIVEKVKINEGDFVDRAKKIIHYADFKNIVIM